MPDSSSETINKRDGTTRRQNKTVPQSVNPRNFRKSLQMDKDFDIEYVSQKPIMHSVSTSPKPQDDIENKNMIYVSESVKPMQLLASLHIDTNYNTESIYQVPIMDSVSRSSEPQDNFEKKNTTQIPSYSSKPTYFPTSLQIDKNIDTERVSPKTLLSTLPTSPRPQPSGYTPMMTTEMRPMDTISKTNSIKYSEIFNLHHPSNSEPVCEKSVIKTVSNTPRPKPSRISLETDTRPIENLKTITDKVRTANMLKYSEIYLQESIWKTLKNVDEVSIEIILNEILDNKVIKLEHIG